MCGRTQRSRCAEKERQSRRTQAALPQRSPGTRPEQHEQAPLSGGVYDREPERGREHQHAEQRVACRLSRPSRAEHAPRRAEHIIAEPCPRAEQHALRRGVYNALRPLR